MVSKGTVAVPAPLYIPLPGTAAENAKELLMSELRVKFVELVLKIVCLLFFSGQLAAAEIPTSRKGCEYAKNLSETNGFLQFESNTVEEDCLYYFLLDANFDETKDMRSIHDRPPPEKDINITIQDVITQHVELSKGSTYQFNIYGDLYVNWEDSRLTWNEDEWNNLPSVRLRDHHKIWTPPMIDHAVCTDSTVCDIQFDNIELFSDGQLFATARFRYAAFCGIDFSEYPEEENRCCIYFTSFEPMRSIKFVTSESMRSRPRRPIVMQESMDKDKEISRLTQDHTAWFVTEQNVAVTHLGAIESLPALKICLKARKKMSTLTMALRLPVTIATMLMLVSPLFGDLRTQSFVKLFTLCLQTMCFLYLCSIAPPNGFAGMKPKIFSIFDRFYESVFGLTTFSMLVTLCCMALSRAKRSVPPSHRVYLCAKLVNRAVCCIEPDNAANYQRYLEENENQRASSEPNYTQDWRHIYLAINNLCSGIFFSSFLFLLFLDMF